MEVMNILAKESPNGSMRRGEIFLTAMMFVPKKKLAATSAAAVFQLSMFFS
jgi:hypothetical protein